MPNYTAEPEPMEELQAELIFSLNQYAVTPCGCNARDVARLYEKVLKHPLIQLLPKFRQQCARGLNTWRARASFDRSTMMKSDHSLH